MCPLTVKNQTCSPMIRCRYFYDCRIRVEDCKAGLVTARCSVVIHAEDQCWHFGQTMIIDELWWLSVIAILFVIVSVFVNQVLLQTLSGYNQWYRELHDSDSHVWWGLNKCIWSHHSSLKVACHDCFYYSQWAICFPVVRASCLSYKRKSSVKWRGPDLFCSLRVRHVRIWRRSLYFMIVMTNIRQWEELNLIGLLIMETRLCFTVSEDFQYAYDEFVALVSTGCLQTLLVVCYLC